MSKKDHTQVLIDADELAELYRIKQAYEQQQCLMQAIVDTIPGSIYWKDQDGRYLGRNLESVKKMVEQHYEAPGAQPSDIVDKTDLDIFPADVASQFIANDQAVLASGEESRVEEVLRTSDNNIYHHLSIKKPVKDNQGNIIGVIGNTLDITPQKRLAALTEQIRLIEQQLMLMQLFASSIAHELRTPLTTMHIYADEIKDHLVKIQLQDSDNQVMDFTIWQKLYNNTQRITHQIKATDKLIKTFLINDIVIPSGKAFYPCDIGKVVQETIDYYPWLSPQERELLSWHSDETFMFIGDALLMKHILYNLLKNAVHYIRYGDNTGYIKLWTECHKQYNLLYIHNTGSFIAAEDLPHIFDMYYTKRSGGYGIGLAFCNAVMTAFKGSIECRSSEEQGTTFILQFPTIK
ncbi:MAG: hypothetical protein Tsb005_19820 [Gammaproteobacteria bacterium]